MKARMWLLGCVALLLAVTSLGFPKTDKLLSDFTTILSYELTGIPTPAAPSPLQRRAAAR